MRCAVLSFFLLCCAATRAQEKGVTVQGGLVRGDTTKKEVALIFTADEWGDGLSHLQQTLKNENVTGSFFFTGRFYGHPAFKKDLLLLQSDGHYFGPHSDQHLLYCDWAKRDSLLVTRDSFSTDLEANRRAMLAAGIRQQAPAYFVPPYEWWNDSIAHWSRQQGYTLVSFTPGIRTAADYTYPEMGAAYKSSDGLLQWLKDLLATAPQKLNGAFILVHAGTDPRRKDKLYHRLPELIHLLRKAGFAFRRVDEVFAPHQ